MCAHHPQQLLLVFLLVSCALFSFSSGMQVGYYAKTCSAAEKIISKSLHALLLSDVTSSAALLRLAFHDCNVKGCDASILLHDAPGIESELHSPMNFGIRRLDFIDKIKLALEAECPRTVSCADIVVLAARDAVAAMGGPKIQVLTGRKDSFNAYKSLADSSLPPATASVDELRQDFGPMDIDLNETVALLGSHTLGVSHCLSFEDRLKTQHDKSLDPEFRSMLELLCKNRSDNITAAPNDDTSLRFDNKYYSDLLNRKGLLRADANLASDSRTRPIVERFAKNQKDFFNAYTTGFLKLTQAKVLAGGQGEVRRDCRRVN